MRNARKGVPNEADFATTTFHSAFAKPQSGKREGIFSFEIVPEACDDERPKYYDNEHLKNVRENGILYRETKKELKPC